MTLRNATTLTVDALAREMLNEVKRIEKLALEHVAAGYCEEAHYQAVLFSWLRTLGMGACFVEVPYPGERWRERCDLVVLNSPPVWIELKKAWRGLGVGWNPKPAEQLQILLWDCAKLLALTKTKTAGCGIALALFYAQEATPFESQGVTPAVLPSRTELQRALLAWAQHELNWPSVISVLGLNDRLRSRDLRALYFGILERVGEPVLLELEQPSRGLRYSVIGAKISLLADA